MFFLRRVFRRNQQIEQRALALVLGFLARSLPTYLQGLIVGVADAPFPLGGITVTFGYDQFEHWKMMAQQSASMPDNQKNETRCASEYGLSRVSISNFAAISFRTATIFVISCSVRRLI